jgi:hypothetical protein
MCRKCLLIFNIGGSASWHPSGRGVWNVVSETGSTHEGSSVGKSFLYGLNIKKMVTLNLYELN